MLSSATVRAMAAPTEVLPPVLSPSAVLLLLALWLALTLMLPELTRVAPLPRVAVVLLVGREMATAAPTAVPPAEPATALLLMVSLEEREDDVAAIAQGDIVQHLGQAGAVDDVQGHRGPPRPCRCPRCCWPATWPRRCCWSC